MAQNLYQEFRAGVGSSIAPDLFPVEVTRYLQQEAIFECPLYYNWSGREYSNPIFMMDRHLHKTGATQWLLPRVDALDYKDYILNHQIRRGQEGQLNVEYTTISSDLYSKLLKDELYWVLDKSVPFDLKSSTGIALKNWLKQNLEWTTLEKATTKRYPNILTANRNIAGTVPSFDRSLVPLRTTRTAWHDASTLGTFFNSFATPTDTSSANTGGSVDVVLRARDMAEDGGAEPHREAKLPPVSSPVFNDVPNNEYVMLVDPGFVYSLMRDPVYKSGALDRGVIIDSKYQPSLLNNGDYVAKIGSVHIIKHHMLKDLRMLSADGTKIIAWNLLIGGAAWAAGWNFDTLMGEKRDQAYLERVDYIHDYRAVDVQAFSSRYAKTPGAIAGTPSTVENSIIHVFTSLNY